MILDIGSRQTEAARVQGTALQLIRRKMREPWLEILAPDRRQPATGGRDNGRRSDDKNGSPPGKADLSEPHESSRSYYSSRLQDAGTSGKVFPWVPLPACVPSATPRYST